MLLYAGVILAWGDPVTWLWAHWQQRALTSEFHRQQKQFIVTTPPADPAAAKTLVRKDAVAFSKSLKEGHAFGRLTIGRIGLSKVVVVQGTTAGVEADLSKGPGHYMNTPFPGLGGSVAIAGHRTTFGAWFRHIDEIRDGDFIDLEMPYATFHYKVEMHKIVPNNDWIDHPAAGLRAAGAVGLPPDLQRVAPLHHLRPRRLGDAAWRRRLIHALTTRRVVTTVQRFRSSGTTGV